MRYLLLTCLLFSTTTRESFASITCDTPAACKIASQIDILCGDTWCEGDAPMSDLEVYERLNGVYSVHITNTIEGGLINGGRKNYACTAYANDFDENLTIYIGGLFLLDCDFGKLDKEYAQYVRECRIENDIDQGCVIELDFPDLNELLKFDAHVSRDSYSTQACIKAAKKYETYRSCE